MVENHEITALQRIAEFSPGCAGISPTAGGPWRGLSPPDARHASALSRSIDHWRSPKWMARLSPRNAKNLFNSKPARPGGQDTDKGPYLFTEGRKDLANYRSSKG